MNAYTYIAENYFDVPYILWRMHVLTLLTWAERVAHDDCSKWGMSFDGQYWYYYAGTLVKSGH